jgi:epoxide hydrolase-like predicted phosphatase
MAESAQPRDEMLRAIRRIREGGLRVAALTNNWEREADERAEPTRELRQLFHVFVESSREGLRKPDPRIYALACERLEVAPSEAVFLDDIGRNLKPARELGMATIKVAQPESALAELEALLGLALRD